MEDKIIWCGARLGIYSIKVGYQLLNECRECGDWPVKLCWDKAILPKAGAFTWKALHKRILIGDRLKVIGIVGPSRCPMCKANKENANHLLLSCSIASQCWDWLMGKLGWQSVRQVDILSFFKSWPRLYANSFWSDLWIVAPSMVLWKIWRERNRWVFQGLERTTEELLNCIEQGITEVLNARATF